VMTTTIGSKTKLYSQEAHRCMKIYTYMYTFA
jgi:hypothetical protein